MQSQHTNSRESAVPQVTDLGTRIYKRYGRSPGLVALERGSGFTSEVLRFGDRLPLLQAVHDRWSVNRAPFGILENVVWRRVLAQPQKPRRPTPVAVAITSHGSEGPPQVSLTVTHPEPQEPPLGSAPLQATARHGKSSDLAQTPEGRGHPDGSIAALSQGPPDGDGSGTSLLRQADVLLTSADQSSPDTEVTPSGDDAGAVEPPIPAATTSTLPAAAQGDIGKASSNRPAQVHRSGQSPSALDLWRQSPKSSDFHMGDKASIVKYADEVSHRSAGEAGSLSRRPEGPGNNPSSREMPPIFLRQGKGGLSKARQEMAIPAANAAGPVDTCGSSEISRLEYSADRSPQTNASQDAVAPVLPATHQDSFGDGAAAASAHTVEPATAAGTGDARNASNAVTSRESQAGETALPQVVVERSLTSGSAAITPEFVQRKPGSSVPASDVRTGDMRAEQVNRIGEGRRGPAYRSASRGEPTNYPTPEQVSEVHPSSDMDRSLGSPEAGKEAVARESEAKETALPLVVAERSLTSGSAAPTPEFVQRKPGPSVPGSDVRTGDIRAEQVNRIEEERLGPAYRSVSRGEPINYPTLAQVPEVHPSSDLDRSLGPPVAGKEAVARESEAKETALPLVVAERSLTSGSAAPTPEFVQRRPGPSVPGSDVSTGDMRSEQVNRIGEERLGPAYRSVSQGEPTNSPTPARAAEVHPSSDMDRSLGPPGAGEALVLRNSAPTVPLAITGATPARQCEQGDRARALLPPVTEMITVRETHRTVGHSPNATVHRISEPLSRATSVASSGSNRTPNATAPDAHAQRGTISSQLSHTSVGPDATNTAEAHTASSLIPVSTGSAPPAHDHAVFGSRDAAMQASETLIAAPHLPGTPLSGPHSDASIVHRATSSKSAGPSEISTVVSVAQPVCSPGAPQVVLARESQSLRQAWGRSYVGGSGYDEVAPSLNHGVATDDKTFGAVLRRQPEAPLAVPFPLSVPTPPAASSTSVGTAADPTVLTNAVTVLARPVRPLSATAIHLSGPVSRESALLTAPSHMSGLWRRAPERLPGADRHNPSVSSLASPHLVQRAMAAPPAGAGAGNPPALPSLGPNTSKSQTLPAGDLNQLANRVYDLLVRRLAAEKQRRGL